MPQWWVVSQRQQELHKFVKNEFKLAQFPHQENGKWVFDTSLVLVDRNRHVRQAVIPQKQGGPPFVARFGLSMRGLVPAGKTVGSTGQQDKGVIRQAEGKVQEKVGDVKDIFKGNR